MRLTPSRLRDLLNADMPNPQPRAKILAPWIKGYREVVAFSFNEDGDLVFEFAPKEDK